jgi:hypothetical protein
MSKTKFCNYVRVFLTICLLLIAFGCSTEKSNPDFVDPTAHPDLVDQSWLTGKPCAGPCWNGLQIGESKESEVLSTIRNLSFINQKSVNLVRSSMSGLDPYIYAPGVEITGYCNGSRENCIRMRFRVVDDILTEVSILLRNDIRLDQAIEYLGKPDYIGYYLEGVEKMTCEVVLVWSTKQLVLSSERFRGSEMEKYCLDVRDIHKTVPSLKISNVKYESVPALNFLLSTDDGEFFEYTENLSDD